MFTCKKIRNEEPNGYTHKLVIDETYTVEMMVTQIKNQFPDEYGAIRIIHPTLGFTACKFTHGVIMSEVARDFLSKTVTEAFAKKNKNEVTYFIFAE